MIGGLRTGNEHIGRGGRERNGNMKQRQSFWQSIDLVRFDYPKLYLTRFDIAKLFSDKTFFG